MIKSVAVLTSGGDAPGMNAAIRAVVRTGIKKGLKTFVVYEGYKGLYEGNIVEVDRNFVSDIINRGGTIINSARLPEFKEEEVRKVAVEQLKKHNIDALVVIGGEITTHAKVDYEQIARDVLKEIGYDSEDKGIDYRTCNINVVLDSQSHDIALGTNEDEEERSCQSHS